MHNIAKISRAFISMTVFVMIFGATFFSLVQNASAWSMDANFTNGAIWNLKSITFTQDDIDDGVIDEAAITNLNPDGLAKFNALVADQVLGEYLDSDIGDSTRQYELKANGCTSRFGWNDDSWQLVNLRINISGDTCKDVIKKDLVYNQRNPGDQQALNTRFAHVNENTIRRVDNKYQYVIIDPLLPNRYVEVDGEGKPRNTYLETTGDRSTGTLYVSNDSQGQYNISELDKLAEPPTEIGDNGTVVNPAAEAEENPTCESDGGEFSFIVCPGLRFGNEVVLKLDGYINDLLIVNSAYYDVNSADADEGGADSIKGAWANIRNIAYILLIPAMLVMVISTALGFSFFDAYTVKRALPRMFVAIIFMALSYDIATLLINMTNEVGQGIAGIIAAPFGGVENLQLTDVFNSTGLADAGVLGGGVLALVTLGAVGAVSIGILASYLLIASLALLAVFIVLAVREMLIIFLIIMAPIAILSWIFPGNDKPWKLWWGTFSKLLLLYPVIISLLIIGRAFALVVQSTDGGGLITTLLKITAFIGPFFFIPSMFKYAGSALGNVAGMVNNRSKGVFDRQRKYRGQKRSEDMQRKFKDPLTQKRSNVVKKLEGAASAKDRGFLSRKAIGLTARGIGGQNIEARMSEVNARRGKEINDAIATGDDERFRALSAMDAMDAFKKDARAAEIAGLTRVDDNGRRQFKSLGGAWVTQEAVVAAKRQYGSDHSAQQAVLAYEMKKASTSEEKAGLVSRYGALSSSWGMTDREAGSGWIGAAFQNQGEHLEYKSMGVKEDAATGQRQVKLSGAKFAQELYEKKGTYPLSQLSGGSIEMLRVAHQEALATRNSTSSTAEQKADANATLIHMRGIAENLVARGGAGGVMNVGTEDAPQFVATPGGTGDGGVQAMGQGSAHTNQEIRKFVEEVGQYTPKMPPGTTPTR